MLLLLSIELSKNFLSFGRIFKHYFTFLDPIYSILTTHAMLYRVICFPKKKIHNSGQIQLLIISAYLF